MPCDSGRVCRRGTRHVGALAAAGAGSKACRCFKASISDNFYQLWPIRRRYMVVGLCCVRAQVKDDE